MATTERSNPSKGVSREYLRHVEKHGSAIRLRTGVGSDERLDPFAKAHELGVIIEWANPTLVQQPEDRETLRSLDARTWSGGGVKLPDGKLLVLLNINQTRERAAVTVLEEVAHVHFGHQPSNVGLSATHGRSFDPVSEREAYWTAAAALLPSRAVAQAVWREMSTKSLAAKFGVSVELVEFRIRILRLWSWHQEHLAAA